MVLIMPLPNLRLLEGHCSYKHDCSNPLGVSSVALSQQWGFITVQLQDKFLKTK